MITFRRTVVAGESSTWNTDEFTPTCPLDSDVTACARRITCLLWLSYLALHSVMACMPGSRLTHLEAGNVWVLGAECPGLRTWDQCTAWVEAPL